MLASAYTPNLAQNKPSNLLCTGCSCVSETCTRCRHAAYGKPGSAARHGTRAYLCSPCPPCVPGREAAPPLACPGRAQRSPQALAPGAPQGPAARSRGCPGAAAPASRPRRPPRRTTPPRPRRSRRPPARGAGTLRPCITPRSECKPNACGMAHRCCAACRAGAVRSESAGGPSSAVFLVPMSAQELVHGAGQGEGRFRLG